MAAHGSAGSTAGTTTEPAEGDELDPSRPATAPYSPADFRLNLDHPRVQGAAAGGPLLGVRPLLEPAAPVPAPEALDPSLEPLLRPLVWDRLVEDVPAAPVVEPAPVAEPEPAAAPAAEPAPAVEPVVETVAGPAADPLANVPDAVEPPPAVLPEIVTVEPDPVPVAAAPATASVPPGSIPVLAAMPAVAPVAAMQPRRPVAFEPTRPVAAPVAPRRRRRLLPRLLTLLLVLAIGAGGAFAVSRYLLEVPAWADEVRPLADEVAAQRGLTFRDPVVVEELPLDGYATALAATVLPSDVAGRDRLAASWRALGLLDGNLDAAAVGRQAAVDMPAYYDHTRGVVVVAAGVGPTLRSFAIERALAWALLDQQANWGSQLAAASPSAALALRAAVDADALVVARAAIGTPAEQQRLAADAAAWTEVVLGGAAPDGSWLPATIGRPGAALAPVLANSDDAQRDALLATVGLNDGALFDLGRGTDAPLSSLVTDPSSTRGLLLWYQVLAARLGPSAAWAAATAWAGDTTAVTVESGSQVCLSALITARDAAGGLRLQQAFTQWAALAPPAATTTAAAVGETQVNLRACDPGVAAAPAPDAPPVTRPPDVPFGGASVEAAVVARAMLVTADLPATVRVCLVDRVRASLTALTPADAAPVVLPAVGWAPPALAAVDVPGELAVCQAG